MFEVCIVIILVLNTKADEVIFKTHIIAHREVEATFNWQKSFMSITVVNNAKSPNAPWCG